MFINRDEAANLLAQKLIKYKGEKGVILAIPRGAVPMGRIIAEEIGFKLEPILIKKIGHPDNPEYAIGAASMSGSSISRENGVSPKYIAEETERVQKILKERFKNYMGKKEPQDLYNKIAVIVDDGVATGNSMLTAIRLVRSEKPKKIVVAIPVAPASAIPELEAEADEVICLTAPEEFYAVGQFYGNFPQVSDDEVIEELRKMGR